MAARVKVIDLAKELGVTSKELLVALAEMGLKGQRTATPLEEPTARQLRTKFGRGRKIAPEPKGSKATKLKATSVTVEAPVAVEAPGTDETPVKALARSGDAAADSA